MERAVDIFCFVGRLPFAVDRSEAARVDDAIGLSVYHLEGVLAEVCIINGLLRVAGPGERLDKDAIKAEHLLRGVSRVIVIEPHGGRGRARCGREDRNEYK